MASFVGLLLSTNITLWLFVIFPICVLVYTSLWILYCFTWHPLANVPGPFWASITRLWYMYRLYAGDMDQVQRALHKKYGPSVRVAPDEVSSSRSSDIPLIYRDREPLLKTDFYPIWADPSISKEPDLFTCIDERVHAQKRRVLNPVYTLSNILKNEQHIATCTSLFIQRLGEYADTKEDVDLGQWSQMYAFDVIGELLFGNMFGFMERRHDHGSYIASLDALLPPMIIAAVAPVYYRPFILGSSIIVPATRRAIQGLDGIRIAALTAVAQRRKQVEDGTANRYDLLQQMMDIVHEKGDGVNFTHSEVSLNCWTDMFAGSDTTASAIRACFYYLIKNPECQRKVQAELDAATPSLSSPIKYIESIKLPYLCASIKEAMRLFPSVALNLQRTSPPGGLDLSGKYIPRGYRVGINPAVVSYDENTFGVDAESFRPERWLVSEDQVKAMDRALLTFGAGTRICVGKNMSLVEIYTAVPEVLRHFTLEMDGDWKIMSRWFNKQTDFIVRVRQRNM